MTDEADPRAEGAAQPRLWASLREAIRGTDRDLTSISIERAAFLLAVPTVLEMSMESLLTVVDVFFASRLGPSAVATLGLTESMLAPVYALAMGLSAGATAIVARRTGEKDPDGAAIATVHALGIAIAVAAAFGVVSTPFAPRLLGWMGASPEVVEVGSSYAAVMFGGSVTIFLLFVVNAIFRAAGDAATAMRSLWLANALNMVLAPCFIFGIGPVPRMGVVGAAIAMTLARAVGVAYQMSVLLRGRRRLAVLARHFVAQIPLLREIARISTPAALQVLVETASWLGLVRIVAMYGSAALAGYTIAMRAVVFALLPSWGFASAAATLVGQNLGAGQPDRASRSVWKLARYNVTFLGPVGLVFALVPGAVVGLFTDDPATAAPAVDCLRIVAAGFVAFAYGMVAMQAFNGAGDTRTPMLVNLVSFWFFKIPLAWVLARVAGLGPRGVFLAITAGYVLQSVTAAVLFRRGRWRAARVGGGAEASERLAPPEGE